MYRFTIRDLLWLTALLAMGAGWYGDRRRLENKSEVWKSSSTQLMRLMARDGWDIQGGIGGLTADKGEQSFTLVNTPIEPFVVAHKKADAPFAK